MSDPWLSFASESRPRTLRVAVPGSRLPKNDESAGLALFPELLGGCTELDDATISKPNAKKNVTQVIKVKVLPNHDLNNEELDEDKAQEDLVRYLSGQCKDSGYELEHIADVTAECEDLYSQEGVTIDLGQLGGGECDAEELSPSCSTSSRSLGSDGEGYNIMPSSSSTRYQQHYSEIEYSTTQQRQSELNSLSGRSCLSGSKSAQAARENRIKKKNYINGLEISVDKLSGENKLLKTEVGSLKATVDELSTEVQYLKNVLANQSALSSLLKNTLRTPGLQFLSSEFDSEDIDVEKVEPVRESNQQSTRKRMLEEDLCLSSDEEEEDSSSLACSSRSIATSSSTTAQMSTRMRSRKLAKVDHDYADPRSGKVAPHAGRSRDLKTLEASKENVNVHNQASSGGICLHVSNKTVSLEFCAECSRKATSSTRGRHLSQSHHHPTARNTRSYKGQVQV